MYISEKGVGVVNNNDNIIMETRQRKRLIGSLYKEDEDDNSSPRISVVVERGGVTTAQVNALMESSKFCEWFEALKLKCEEEGWTAKRITVQSIDMFGKKVGFAKLKVDIVDRDGVRLPGIVFMRGASVAILVILVCIEENSEYVLLTVQPRIAVPEERFLEIPAGMMDDEGSFTGVAAKELEEETGIRIWYADEDLFDLDPEHSSRGYYPSPGGCDEQIKLFLYKKHVTLRELKEMQGRLTGVLAEGERITLRVEAIDSVLRHTKDMKTLAALCLYMNK